MSVSFARSPRYTEKLASPIVEILNQSIPSRDLWLTAASDTLRSWCSTDTDDLSLNTVVNQNTMTPPALGTPPPTEYKVGQIVEVKTSRWEPWKFATVKTLHPLRCVPKGGLIRQEFKFVQPVEFPPTWLYTDDEELHQSSESLRFLEASSSMSSESMFDNLPDLPLVSTPKRSLQRQKKSKFAKAKAYLLGKRTAPPQKRVPVRRHLSRSRTLEC